MNRLVKIKDSIETVSNLIKAYKRMKKYKLEAGTEKCTREVHEVSQDLVKIIEKVTDINLSYASDFLDLEKQKVLYNLTQLENVYSRYNSIHKRHEQILNEKHDVTFFLRQISLAEEFDLLEHISSPDEPKEIERFQRDGFVCSIIELIERKYSLRQAADLYQFSEKIIKDKIVAVAIQIGRDESGFAYKFNNEFGNDPSDISSLDIESRNSMTTKIPNSILLDSAKRFVAFGKDAEDQYFDLVREEKHHDWYFFDQFTKNIPVLDGEQEVRNCNMKTFDLRKEIPLLALFRMIINFFVDRVSCAMNPSRIFTREMQWVLAIPESWNRSTMRKLFSTSFREAGIDDLIIESEPEVAALFCRYVLLREDAFHPGTKYVLLDFEGDTVDVIVRQVQQGKTLRELLKTNGEAWRSTHVKEAFKQTIIKLVGKPSYLHFCEQNPVDVADMYRDFHLKKKIFSGKGNEFVSIKIPFSLQKTFEKDTGNTIHGVLGQSALSGQMK
ncbi:unnamed protein product [Mytilus coruscus]|uniref:Uncharacterized protein n=1 Tax=Mytilus coruscus TaxID=42192 RepID=A0A6J7ZYW7_MYTCO|nr:unnamed protein product [Mytilus coruscus]